MASNIIKILRSITRGSRPTTGHTYGEPYVNLTDNQFGVLNSSNVCVDLIGVPFFSASTTYAAGTPVVNGGNLYVSLVAITTPAAFNPAQWTLVGTQSWVNNNYVGYFAQGLTGAQGTVARANIGAAANPNVWTRSVIGSTGTYTVKSGCTAILVRMVGGGGGGGGSGSAAGGNATAGGTSQFAGTGINVSAGGGNGGTVGGGITGGGAPSGGNINSPGGNGAAGMGAGTGNITNPWGGAGSASCFGGGGPGGFPGAGGTSASPYGAGGGGGGMAGTGSGGSGGGGGAYNELLITGSTGLGAPGTVYTVNVGGSGGAGAATTGGQPGGNGQAGIVWIDEYY